MNHLKSLLKQKIAAYEKLVKFTWLKFETTNSQHWLSKHCKVCDALYNAYDVVSLSGKVIFTIDIENV